MEIVELDDHPYFVATQYHPEYLSRPLKPSPPFFGLILASVGKLQSYIARGCRLTPRQLSDVESGNYKELIAGKIVFLKIFYYYFFMVYWPFWLYFLLSMGHRIASNDTAQKAGCSLLLMVGR
jgi:hypothetical protein